jgi:plasmid stabilization system protein ParE
MPGSNADAKDPHEFAGQAGLRGILDWSVERFREEAMRRYRNLIRTALRDLVVDPDEPGRRLCPELGQGKRSWHLRLSRDRVRDDRVLSPRVLSLRHIILPV